MEHKFPVKQPEHRDFSLWKRAIGFLYREDKLFHEVGKYVKAPHLDWQWSALADRAVLYRQWVDGGEDRTDVFH